MYVTNMLSKIGMLGAEYDDTPTDPDLKLMFDEGYLLEDLENYKRLPGKLIYHPTRHLSCDKSCPCKPHFKCGDVYSLV